MPEQDQQPRSEKPVRDEIEIGEAAVVSLLLSEVDGTWARADLERELGFDEMMSSDVLTNLASAGLIHLSGEIVVVSRAARRMDELQL